MSNLNQLLMQFNYQQNFRFDDFYVSKSNSYIFNFLNNWPKWEKNFVNIFGEKFSGKTHLTNIFIKNFKGIKLNSTELDDNTFQKIKVHQNIVIENLDDGINETLFYSILNTIEQDNKYLLVTSHQSIVDIDFKLNDLKSRTSNFLLQNIANPDDELVFALILKNLSDRQIFLDKKLINFIAKRVDRSYRKISDFIYKIDEISLKRGKSIDFKIIKEVLGE
jgi:chromosomal replication initiation ATPase DnaA|tara:strand:+ start:942 stop:1604 length:663 start_codon:yes stop_codon:yes gene_type:complete